MREIYLLQVFVVSVYSNVVSDVTDSVKLKTEGVVAGYGDFDADRTTDIFIISKNWTVVELFEWHTNTQTFQRNGNIKIKAKLFDSIVGIALADFDGNGCMDVLLSTKSFKTPDVVTIEIYYGDTKTLSTGTFVAEMLDQPTIVDINGDLLPDLFGASKETGNKEGIRSYWLSLPNIQRFHREEQYIGIIPPLVIPQSNGFLDVTGDMHAEILIKSQSESDGIMFETWQPTQPGLNFSLTSTMFLGLPNVKHMGQVSFADVDADGRIDMLLPACLTDDCSNSVLYVKKHVSGAWSTVMNNNKSNWRWPLTDMKKPMATPISFVTVRVGDFTMDGMVDAVTILELKSTGNKVAAYLENVKCAESHCAMGRRLDVHILQNLEKPVAISLLDVYENGGLDFIVTCQNKANPSDYFTVVLKNDFNIDTAFLKVAVLSGRCYKSCSDSKGSITYGANQYGGMVSISTANTDGSLMKGQEVQLSQSAYFSLQLPYIVFGLGKLPNFVDKIKVGIPKGAGNVDRVRDWTAIIPNAQVIVIPYPRDKPSDWMTKLLVTPSKLLLQTGGVLLGTCLLIAGLILILHIKEKKEDEREKRKESHKFHFDAL